MYTQRVGIFKYRISLTTGKEKHLIVRNYYLWLIQQLKHLKIFTDLEWKWFLKFDLIKVESF